MAENNNVELSEIIRDFQNWFDEVKLEIKSLTENQYKIYLEKDIKTMFEINDDKLKRWQKDGLAYTKLGHTLVFVWDDIRSFLERHKVK